MVQNETHASDNWDVQNLQIQVIFAHVITATCSKNTQLGYLHWIFELLLTSSQNTTIPSALWNTSSENW